MVIHAGDAPHLLLRRRHPSLREWNPKNGRSGVCPAQTEADHLKGKEPATLVIHRLSPSATGPSGRWHCHLKGNQL